MAIGAAVAAGAGAIGGLANIGFGIADRLAAKRLRAQSLEKWKAKSGFQEYGVPESVDKYIDYMGTLSRQQMPGYNLMQQGIQQTTAAGLTGARQLAGSGPAALGALGGLMSDRQRQLRQLGIMASQYQRGAQQDYAGAIMSRAPYEQQQFEYNQWLPWQMKMNEAMGLRGAGQQQLMSGIDQTAAAGINYTNMQAQQQWYDRMSPYQSYMGGNPQAVSQGMTDPGRPTYSPPPPQQGQINPI